MSKYRKTYKELSKLCEASNRRLVVKELSNTKIHHAVIGDTIILNKNYHKFEKKPICAMFRHFFKAEVQA